MRRRLDFGLWQISFRCVFRQVAAVKGDGGALILLLCWPRGFMTDNHEDIGRLLAPYDL